MSGAAPTSTTSALAKDVPLEKAQNGSSDLPGAFPETPAATEKGDFSVNPLPATEGASNPVTLAPGEKVPHHSNFTANTITSGVHDDPELVAADKAKSAGTFDASPSIQSSGPQSTTANLAANVPLESSKVPEVVKESQAAAGVEPAASAVPEEVQEKSAVEQELLKEVPTAPSTSEGTAGKGTEKSEKTVTAGDAAAALGGAATAVGGAAAIYASGAASKLPPSVTSKLPESVQNSINSINAGSGSKTTETPTATSVEPTTAAKHTPAIVKESIAESGKAPEAAGNEEAVLEKKAVEKELLSEIKPETSTGESAPKIAGATTSSSTAPASTATPSTGLAAPASPKATESRDVSPGTVPGSHTQTAPVVTTGVAPSTADKVSTPATPSKAEASSSKASESPAASSTTTDKKKKRSSIFGKLKAKLSHKDKD